MELKIDTNSNDLFVQLDKRILEKSATIYQNIDDLSREELGIGAVWTILAEILTSGLKKIPVAGKQRGFNVTDVIILSNNAHPAFAHDQRAADEHGQGEDDETRLI